MKTRPRARTSSSSAHPHSRTIHYSKVGGLRRKASDVERWLVDRKQVAPSASQRFGLLAGKR